jgi:ABC-type phosphate transport system substrate-binding protein
MDSFKIQYLLSKSGDWFKRLLCTMLLLYGTQIYSQTQTLTVISNEKGAPTELKLTELKSIFKGEKQRWRDGNKITIALMKTNTPVGAYTCKKIYDMNGDDVKKFWLALVFQGKAEGPQFFNSITELESFVADNPGAIGITDQSQSSANAHVVLIDGKKTL